MITVSTSCTGLGSPEQYLKDSNIMHQIKFACEIDKYARQSYLSNFQPNLMLHDMTKENWDRTDIFQKEDKLYSDLFIAGIPCQSFSLAGKRLGELDKRGLLFFDGLRYIDKQRPKAFIYENVKGLISDNRGVTFQNWLHLLGQSVNHQKQMFPHPDSLNYNLHWTILNAKDYGTPQNRERVFLVGIRNDLSNNFSFPKPFALEKRLIDILEKNVDDKYFLSEKLIAGFIQHMENSKEKNRGFKFSPITEPETELAACSNASCYKMAITDNYIFEKTDEIIIEGLLQGETWQKTHETSRRVYSPGGIAPTLPTMQGGYQEPKILLNGKIRKLTPTECFRLQGFPDYYIKPCSDSQLYKQAGNSIHTGTIGGIIENLLPIIS